jgi:glycosyltransferase involved in cell wall biosynthesis
MRSGILSPKPRTLLQSAPRKLLFYLYSLAGGGAERVIALLASGFAARGWETILAVQFEARENAGFIDPAVRIELLGAEHGATMWRLARLLKRERPDISLSALGFCNLKHALASTLAGRRNRAILSFHGHIDVEPGFASRVASRLAPVTTRLTARSVCVSDWMRHHVVEELHGCPRRAITIHNPAPIDHAAPAIDEATLLAREAIILALGRLVPEKGFATLIDAFARLDQPGAKLVILGEGPERAALEQRVLALGLAGRVGMPGYVTEPWAYFARARVCAVSSASESFSNVAVEALAHGLPVVSTDCGGPAEIISRPQEGRLVPVGDVAALSEALAAALRAPGDPAPRMARADMFSLQRVLDAYERLFEEVIAEATRS